MCNACAILPLRVKHTTISDGSVTFPQPARFRVITCGNHEYPVEAEPDKWRRRMSNATLLLNEAITIEGIKLWASPVTPLYGGAFG